MVKEDGTVVASTDFIQPSASVPGIAPQRQSPVMVAAGGAYFMDSRGKVKRLDAHGVTAITTFPVDPRSVAPSFAVSPDGGQLMATILESPPLTGAPINGMDLSGAFGPGDWSFQTLLAKSGGIATATQTTDLGFGGPLRVDVGPPGQVASSPIPFLFDGTSPIPFQVIGWDDKGPLALVQPTIGRQYSPPNQQLDGLSLQHVAVDGRLLDQLGGRNCQPFAHSSDGTMACLTTTGPEAWSFQVESASGQPLWSPPRLPSDMYGDIYLYNPVISPDGDQLASHDYVFTKSGSISSAARLNLPSPPYSTDYYSKLYRPDGDFTAEGWLNENTLIGGDQHNALSIVTTGAGGSRRDLRVSGQFEGLT
ncbi:MAG TPA: hypothetical protein VG015_01430 [Candidatus Dormibacteraeota bacterium]|jgi:hypothetical protein|nr:hypothetical protein [Candidatus Dormibacteraeota bacterium]